MSRMNKFFIFNKIMSAVIITGSLSLGQAYAGENNFEKKVDADSLNYQIDVETQKKLTDAYRELNKTASVKIETKKQLQEIIKKQGLEPFELTEYKNLYIDL